MLSRTDDPSKCRAHHFMVMLTGIKVKSQASWVEPRGSPMVEIVLEVTKADQPSLCVK
jgi:hypothetical protein